MRLFLGLYNVITKNWTAGFLLYLKPLYLTTARRFLRSLVSKISVGQDCGSDDGPGVNAGADPWRHDFDPHGSQAHDFDPLAHFRNIEPVGQRHHNVQGSQRKYEMEVAKIELNFWSDEFLFS